MVAHVVYDRHRHGEGGGGGGGKEQERLGKNWEGLYRPPPLTFQKISIFSQKNL